MKHKNQVAAIEENLISPLLFPLFMKEKKIGE